MTQAFKKSLEDVAFELRGIKHVLASMWHSRYKNEDTDQVSPEFFADEYISTEECARRLGVTDQTIRNWILVGRHEPDKGWTQGVHYIMINPLKKKQIIRIPWNHLILSYSKGSAPTLRSFDKGMDLYQDHRSKKTAHIPDPTKPRIDMEEDDDEEGTEETP
jgi:hypothetical protein